MLESSLNSPTQELPIAEGIYVCQKISPRTNGAAISVYQNQVNCPYCVGGKCLTDKADISIEEFLSEEVIKVSPFTNENPCFVWESAQRKYIALTKPKCTGERAC